MGGSFSCQRTLMVNIAMVLNVKYSGCAEIFEEIPQFFLAKY